MLLVRSLIQLSRVLRTINGAVPSQGRVSMTPAFPQYGRHDG